MNTLLWFWASANFFQHIGLLVCSLLVGGFISGLVLWGMRQVGKPKTTGGKGFKRKVLEEIPSVSTGSLGAESRNSLVAKVGVTEKEKGVEKEQEVGKEKEVEKGGGLTSARESLRGVEEDTAGAWGNGFPGEEEE